MLHYYSTICHLHLNSESRTADTSGDLPTLLLVNVLTVQAGGHTHMAGASIWRLLCVWSGPRHPMTARCSPMSGWAASPQPGQAGSGKSCESSDSSLGCGWGSFPEQEVSTESILAHSPRKWVQETWGEE